MRLLKTEMPLLWCFLFADFLHFVQFGFCQICKEKAPYRYAILFLWVLLEHPCFSGWPLPRSSELLISSRLLARLIPVHFLPLKSKQKNDLLISVARSSHKSFFSFYFVSASYLSQFLYPGVVLLVWISNFYSFSPLSFFLFNASPAA